MNKKYFVLSFIFIFILGFKVKGQEKELIFSDDFSGEKISEKWKLDSPHSWEVKDGVLQTTKYGGSATIKEELPDDIVVEVKVKPIEANPELPGGFGGVAVSGINFVIRKEGFWWPYKRPGDERYSGGSKKSDIILGKWYQFKVIRRTGGLFEWYVDGEKICEIIEPVMKGKEVGFNAWRFKISYDDIKIYKVTSAKQTGNLNIIKNSSFEILQDNLPIYWSPIGSLNLTYGGMENFLKLWCIDTNEKFHGKQSLRIEKGGVYSFYFSAEKNSPYVLSVYMKSDREQLPVELAIWEWNIGKFHKAVVNVDKEWKRYICRAETNQTGMLRVRIEKKDEGILWIDAVKLEKGTEPTEYTISPFDLDEKEEKREIKIEEYIIKKVDKPPVIDGELDDIVWQKGLKIEFLIAGEKGEIFKPKEKTEGYLCYDDKGIYIAFKCYDSQIDKIKANVKEDDGPVWNDDCVEIFLDTNNDKRTYYHIAINSLGKIKVIDKENNQPFKGKIERGVSIKKDHWIVEVFIPFSSLNITSQTSQVWGFNLGRENHKIGEYSCTSPTKYLNFHDVENYNLLVFPEKELFKKYIVEKKEEKKLPKKGPFIVDGKPFFVFAPLEQFFFGYNWFYKDGWENEIEKKIKFWKDEGFRSIVVVSKIFPFEMSEKGWAKLFEIANKYDLKLVVWPGFKPKEGIENNFEKFIEKYKENKCIIAWCVGDEPEIQSDVKPEEIIEVVKRTKQVDPKHPVFVNYTPLGPSIRYAGLPGDILSTDLYITAGRTIREVVELVKLKDKIAREKNMWVWMWLVGNNMHNHFREPTAEEQEGQTYGAIISGCTGLMYFYGECFGYKNWMKLKQLSKETEILAPIIFSEEIEGIESNHPDILTMGRNHGNKYYVFSVNINKDELDGKIILTKEMKKYKKCKVVFENREIDIKDGIIIDKFAPYQRHVYELMK